MRFRRSSYSDPNQDCVEIRHTAAFLGVRDSKLAHSPVLTVTAERGRTFLSAVQTDRFDR
jgi:hypothetical protein